jgi:CRISPR-associated protein Csd1
VILQDLVALYQREAARGRVLPYGYSMEQISWVLLIDRDGQVIDVEDRRNGNKTPRIPAPTPPKSTVDIAPRYLYGNASYVLGVLTESQQKKKAAGKDMIRRCQKEHAAWVAYHRDHCSESYDEGLRAVLRFCERWTPTQFALLRYSDEIIKGTIALSLDGDKDEVGNPRLIYDRPAARELWSRLSDPLDGPEGLCLVTGERARIANLHNSLKGVRNAKPSGASLVSYNCDAVRHYGPDSQGINGPVSSTAMHAYTTVLNAMLAHPDRKLLIGDATAVFWVEADGDAVPAEVLLAALLGAIEVKPGEDAEAARLRETLSQIAAGRPLADADPRLDATTRYHVLALGPAESRLVVRWYLVGILGDLARRVGEHWQDMTINPCPWRTPPSVQWVALQTVPARPRKDGGYERDRDDINPTFPGDLLRSILTGQRYPSGLLQTLVQRISTDRDVNRLRIALIRACLERDHRLGISTQGAPMALDPDNPSTAYQLGRFFAVLERIYRAANPNSERTLADTHYRMACTQPAAAFPRLRATAQHHLAAIRRDSKGGLAFVLDRDLADIASRIGVEFPPTLRVADQGRFALGYDHQRTVRKVSDTTAVTADSQEE